MLYFEPEFKVISIDLEDVVRTSSSGSVDHGADDHLLQPDPI